MIEFNINRILVPVDFSPASFNALDTAIAMAKQHEARILLLNVVETSVLPGFPGDAYISEETVKKHIQHALQLIKDALGQNSLSLAMLLVKFLW